MSSQEKSSNSEIFTNSSDSEEDEGQREEKKKQYEKNKLLQEEQENKFEMFYDLNERDHILIKQLSILEKFDDIERFSGKLKVENNSIMMKQNQLSYSEYELLQRKIKSSLECMFFDKIFTNFGGQQLVDLEHQEGYSKLKKKYEFQILIKKNFEGYSLDIQEYLQKVKPLEKIILSSEYSDIQYCFLICQGKESEQILKNLRELIQNQYQIQNIKQLDQNADSFYITKRDKKYIIQDYLLPDPEKEKYGEKNDLNFMNINNISEIEKENLIEELYFNQNQIKDIMWLYSEFFQNFSHKFNVDFKFIDINYNNNNYNNNNKYRFKIQVYQNSINSNKQLQMECIERIRNLIDRNQFILVLKDIDKFKFEIFKQYYEKKLKKYSGWLCSSWDMQKLGEELQEQQNFQGLNQFYQDFSEYNGDFVYLRIKKNDYHDYISPEIKQYYHDFVKKGIICMEARKFQCHELGPLFQQEVQVKLLEKGMFCQIKEKNRLKNTISIQIESVAEEFSDNQQTERMQFCDQVLENYFHHIRIIPINWAQFCTISRRQIDELRYYFLVNIDLFVCDTYNDDPLLWKKNPRKAYQIYFKQFYLSQIQIIKERNYNCFINDGFNYKRFIGIKGNLCVMDQIEQKLYNLLKEVECEHKFKVLPIKSKLTKEYYQYFFHELKQEEYPLEEMMTQQLMKEAKQIRKYLYKNVFIENIQYSYDNNEFELEYSAHFSNYKGISSSDEQEKRLNVHKFIDHVKANIENRYKIIHLQIDQRQLPQRMQVEKIEWKQYKKDYQIFYKQVKSQDMLVVGNDDGRNLKEYYLVGQKDSLEHVVQCIKKMFYKRKRMEFQRNQKIIWLKRVIKIESFLEFQILKQKIAPKIEELYKEMEITEKNNLEKLDFSIFENNYGQIDKVIQNVFNPLVKLAFEENKVQQFYLVTIFCNGSICELDSVHQKINHMLKQQKKEVKERGCKLTLSVDEDRAFKFIQEHLSQKLYQIYQKYNVFMENSNQILNDQYELKQGEQIYYVYLYDEVDVGSEVKKLTVNSQRDFAIKEIREIIEQQRQSLKGNIMIQQNN